MWPGTGQLASSAASGALSWGAHPSSQQQGAGGGPPTDEVCHEAGAQRHARHQAAVLHQHLHVVLPGGTKGVAGCGGWCSRHSWGTLKAAAVCCTSALDSSQASQPGPLVHLRRAGQRVLELQSSDEAAHGGEDAGSDRELGCGWGVGDRGRDWCAATHAAAADARMQACWHALHNRHRHQLRACFGRPPAQLQQVDEGLVRAGRRCCRALLRPRGAEVSQQVK